MEVTKMISNKLFLIVLVSLVMFSVSVFAIQGQPHQFWGDVTVNGAPAPDGTVVSAFIDGSQVATTTTSGGIYGTAPASAFYVPDTDPASRAGKTISFFVNGINTGTTFVFTALEANSLNFTVTISSPPSSGGSSSGGGGGGGGGGSSGGGATSSGGSSGGSNGSSTGTTTTTTSGTCTEQWACTDWSSCTDGLQTRSCTDANACGTDNNKPIESQPCSTVTGETTSAPGQQAGLGITGLITGNPTIMGAIVVIVLVIIYILWRSMKKKKK